MRPPWSLEQLFWRTQPSLLMTANEAMAALRVPRRMLYYFIEKDLLDPVRIGQRITRYRASEASAIANSGFDPLRLPGQLKNHKAEDAA
jgi:hypothetical protein